MIAKFTATAAIVLSAGMLLPRAGSAQQNAGGEISPDSLRALIAAAERGDRRAQYELRGLRGLHGDDNAEAVHRLRAAAEQGHAGTQFWLGAMYADPVRGAPTNDAEAVRWWRAAARQGHADAQFELGLKLNKLGVIDVEGVRWLRAAAEQGHAGAPYWLGITYANASSRVPANDAEAVRWYHTAAERGHVFAQMELASRYRGGPAPLSRTVGFCG